MISFRPEIYQRHEAACKTEANPRTDERKPCSSLREAIGVGENEDIASEESEENDVDGDQIQSDQPYDRLPERQQERSVKGMHQPVQKGLLANLDLGSVALIPCNPSQLGCLQNLAAWVRMFRVARTRLGIRPGSRCQRDPFDPAP